MHGFLGLFTEISTEIVNPFLPCSPDWHGLLRLWQIIYQFVDEQYVHDIKMPTGKMQNNYLKTTT